MNQLNRVVTRFRFVSRALRLMPIVAVAGLLTGCIHTTPRSGEVRGRVLDAITHVPIQGAKIFFVSSPHHAVYTDSAGCFHRKAIRNLHFFYGVPEGHWPTPQDSS